MEYEFILDGLAILSRELVLSADLDRLFKHLVKDYAQQYNPYPTPFLDKQKNEALIANQFSIIVGKWFVATSLTL